jgi:predicted MFS family arabinose efflux permease
MAARVAVIHNPRHSAGATSWRRIAWLTIARLLINTGLRLVYPFLPVLARGVDRPVADLSRLLALRGAAGLLGPLLGPIADRHDRRKVLVVGMLIFALGMLAVAIRPDYWMLALSLVLVALAKIIFDPAMQAMVADEVAYARRGVALAATELSWAGAFLIGAPIVGWLIARGPWRLGAFASGPAWTRPFLIMGMAALVVAMLLWRRIPARAAIEPDAGWISPLTAVGRLRRPEVAAAAGFVGVIMLANEMVFVVYGSWLDQTYGLQITSIGLTVMVIGGAELLGEAMVGWIVDRAGKLKVVVGMSLGAAAFMLLCAAFLGPLRDTGWLGPPWLAPLLALGGAFLCFEMAYVGSLPLLSELDPGARATIMSLVVAAMSLGRMGGALLGPTLWSVGQMTTVTLAAAASFAGAAALLASAVSEPPTDRPSGPVQ